MSAAAARPPHRPDPQDATPFPGPRPGILTRARRLAARIGPAGIASGGFVAGLGWAFAGSLWLRLGTGGVIDTAIAWWWLAGEGLICGLTMAALWLAPLGPQDPKA